MGVSTDGQLSFGIDFGEDFQFPWDEEKYEGDYEEWWMEVQGFKNPTESPYDENGEYKEGVTRDSVVLDEYHGNRSKWREQNPFPIKVVNHCSGDYPMYILAVKGYFFRCYRGESMKIDIKEDMIVNEIEIMRFKEFLKTYKIETSDSPKWLLSSFWG